jgi:hypothetical protein
MIENGFICRSKRAFLSLDGDRRCAALASAIGNLQAFKRSSFFRRSGGQSQLTHAITAITTTAVGCLAGRGAARVAAPRRGVLWRARFACAD